MPLKDLKQRQLYNRKYNKEYYRKNRKEILLQTKKYRENHQKEINEKQKPYQKIWQKNNKNKVNTYRKRYLDKHPIQKNKAKICFKTWDKHKNIISKSKCASCNSPENLQFHHTTNPYEIDKFMILCQDCHKEIQHGQI